MLTRFVKIQLVIFLVAAIVSGFIIDFVYLQVPTMLGIGRTTVTLELPASGGLYRFANVTYRGVQIGKVTDVTVVRKNGKPSVAATLSLDASPEIPADLTAEVRSVSAIGEQYVDLLPRTSSGPYLQDGSVIPVADTAIPKPVGPLLERTSALLDSVPKDTLQALIDESFKGFGGSGYDLGSLFDSSSTIAKDMNSVADRTATLTEDSVPLLDSQAQTTDALRLWVASLAGVSEQVADNDPQIRTLLQSGPGAADEVSRLLDQIQPTLPVLLANMTTLGQILVTYNASLEQLLVLVPPLESYFQAEMASSNPTGMPIGDFRLVIGDPPACTVGFLPPSSWRSPADTTVVDTPDGLYCKLPQDSPTTVRGARNYPCMGHPGKRAPTVEICDSDKPFEPLAMRQHALGPYPVDPNLISQGVPPDDRVDFGDRIHGPLEGTPMPPGTATPGPPPSIPPGAGQIPPVAPGSAPPPAATGDGAVPAAPSGLHQSGSTPPGPSVAVASYDPGSGRYVAPDGHVVQQSNLVKPAHTWQDLIMPADQ